MKKRYTVTKIVQFNSENSKLKERTTGDDNVRSNDSGRDSVDGRERGGCGGTVKSNLNEWGSAQIEVAQKSRRV